MRIANGSFAEVQPRRLKDNERATAGYSNLSNSKRILARISLIRHVPAEKFRADHNGLFSQEAAGCPCYGIRFGIRISQLRHGNRHNSCLILCCLRITNSTDNIGKVKSL